MTTHLIRVSCRPEREDGRRPVRDRRRNSSAPTDDDDYEQKLPINSSPSYRETVSETRRLQRSRVTRSPRAGREVLGRPHDTDNATAGSDMRRRGDDHGRRRDADADADESLVLEGNTATTDLVFEATLAAPHPALTFNFRTVDGHRQGTADFDATSRLEDLPRESTTPKRTSSDHDQGQGRHCSTSSTRP